MSDDDFNINDYVLPDEIKELYKSYERDSVIYKMETMKGIIENR